MSNREKPFPIARRRLLEAALLLSAPYALPFDSLHEVVWSVVGAASKPSNGPAAGSRTSADKPYAAPDRAPISLQFSAAAKRRQEP